ncbi:NAD-dependent epimerase/dehydratase family protein [Streptomyces sp. CA-249302]|uniref:NAD-dependent epimerase/dehydratase family protein n=1 Tax=Streptomyces sp. CA-249302 TaxID=3240058 RepID=UPI003D90B237
MAGCPRRPPSRRSAARGVSPPGSRRARSRRGSSAAGSWRARWSADPPLAPRARQARPQSPGERKYPSSRNRANGLRPASRLVGTTGFEPAASPRSPRVPATPDHAACHSSALTGQDRRTRILVIGGTWFLGKKITEGVLAKGWSVTTFNRGRSGQDVEGVETVRGDRTAGDDLQRLARQGTWDAVIDVQLRLPAPRHPAGHNRPKCRSSPLGTHLHRVRLPGVATPVPDRGVRECRGLPPPRGHPGPRGARWTAPLVTDPGQAGREDPRPSAEQTADPAGRRPRRGRVRPGPGRERHERRLHLTHPDGIAFEGFISECLSHRRSRTARVGEAGCTCRPRRCSVDRVATVAHARRHLGG